MNDIYLVTGAAGHLGSTIIRLLLEQGKAFRVLVLPYEKNLPPGDYDVFYGDVCDKESLQDFFSIDPLLNSIVIHCAGIVSIASKYIQKVYDVNVQGTKNIVDLSVETHVGRLIYISSVHAIPEGNKGEVIREIDHFDPENVIGNYAKTKAEASAYVLLAKKRGLHVNVIHPSGICGPYDYGRGHITSLVKDYYSGTLKMGMDGGYDFVDVRDVAEGILMCAVKGANGECFILSNQYYSIREILDLLHTITQKKKITLFFPNWFVRMIAPMSELYYKLMKQTPLYTAYSAYTLQSNSLFSHQKADDILSYTNRPFEVTLQDTIDWLFLIGEIRNKETS